MPISRVWKHVSPFLILGAILLTSTALIAYGRGYRIDIKQQTVGATGLLAATSDPTGAQILLDGKLVSATNNTVSVKPGWYNVTITKEGFQSWEKRIKVLGEVVSRADAYLFPANPSLSAITTTGAASPTVSPDGTKLAFIIPTQQTATADAILQSRAGIWILDLVDKTLGLNRDRRQIAKSTPVDFTDATLIWSPDSKDIIAVIDSPTSRPPRYFRMPIDQLTTAPIQLIDPENLKTEWQTTTNIQNEERMAGLKPDVSKAIENTMHVIGFSPDETKILYEASVSATLPQMITPPLPGTNTVAEIRTISPGKLYVYDIKEDKNYFLIDTKDLPLFNVHPSPTPQKNQPKKIMPFIATNNLGIVWLPTNRHLMIMSNDKIESIEYDATNRKTIYAGPFANGFAAAWGNASKILILTNLNPAASTYPNLYAVNLR